MEQSITSTGLKAQSTEVPLGMDSVGAHEAFTGRWESSFLKGGR